MKIKYMCSLNKTLLLSFMLSFLVLFMGSSNAYSYDPPCNLSYTTNSCCDQLMYNCGVQESICESGCNPEFENIGCLIENCSSWYYYVDTYCSNSDYVNCRSDEQCTFYPNAPARAKSMRIAQVLIAVVVIAII